MGIYVFFWYFKWGIVSREYDLLWVVCYYEGYYEGLIGGRRCLFCESGVQSLGEVVLVEDSEFGLFCCLVWRFFFFVKYENFLVQVIELFLEGRQCVSVLGGYCFCFVNKCSGVIVQYFQGLVFQDVFRQGFQRGEGQRDRIWNLFMVNFWEVQMGVLLFLMSFLLVFYWQQC